MKIKMYLLFFFVPFFIAQCTHAQEKWSTDYAYFGENGKLTYTPDERGNIIPDFSHVGYRMGDEEIPNVSVAIQVSPIEGDDGDNIQAAIESLYDIDPGENGFRGCVLLTKGEYQINDQITIAQSGIVLRGEGNDENGTILWATGVSDRSLIVAGNNSSVAIERSSIVNIAEDYVPVGRQFVVVGDAADFSAGDLISIYRPGTDAWISAIKMDQISKGTDDDPTIQWSASSYSFYFERILTKVNGDTLYFRNPVVMALDKEFGGGKVYKATSNRLENIGVENMAFKSEYTSENDEDHSWRGVVFEGVENGWARALKSWYFAYSCVSVNRNAKKISVIDCGCYEAKSIITGSRRYSFYCEGQLNLFKECETTEGRHDYITGSRVCGPNVFTQSTARNANADIGPHHRWAMGTLYDQIDTDGEINVQDRDDMGSGHGWSGANQFFWNCKGGGSICQSPWASAKNYNFGFMGDKLNGARTNRPDGVWIGNNVPGLFPESLYETQLEQRLNETVVFSTYTSLEMLNDSTLLMHFNLPLDASTVVSENFIIGGTANIDDKFTEVELVNDRNVKLVFSNLGILPALSTLSVKAENVISKTGLLLTGLNTSSFIFPDERPIAYGVELNTDNEEGSFAVAKSSKKGFVYLILIGEPVATIDDFEQAVSSYKAAKAQVENVDVSIPIYTQGLYGGVYRYYAVDNDGRISIPSDNVVSIQASGSVLVDENKRSNFNCFVDNGFLSVQPSSNEDFYSFTVYSLSGNRIIRKQNLKGSCQFVLPDRLSKVLIVQIMMGDGVLNKKIVY